MFVSRVKKTINLWPKKIEMLSISKAKYLKGYYVRIIDRLKQSRIGNGSRIILVFQGLNLSIFIFLFLFCHFFFSAKKALYK